MGGTQRVVGLQASAAGAVGGGAQQSIGVAFETPALGCARSEVIDHEKGVLGDERQNLIEIRRARPRARQTMGSEPGSEVLLQQGSQRGLESARRPIHEHAEVNRAEDASPDRSQGRHRHPIVSKVQHRQTRANGVP